MRGDEEADASMLEAVDAMEIRGFPLKEYNESANKVGPWSSNDLCVSKPRAGIISFILFYFPLQL